MKHLQKLSESKHFNLRAKLFGFCSLDEEIPSVEME